MTRLLGLFYLIFGVLNINAQESGSFDEQEFTKYLIQATVPPPAFLNVNSLSLPISIDVFLWFLKSTI